MLQPSLIDRIRAISQSIRDLEGLEATETEATGFRTRADDISQFAAKIQVPAERTKLFRHNGIDVQAPDFQARQLRLKLEEMLQKYMADRKSILESSSVWKFDTKTGLDSVASKTNQELRAAWIRYVTNLKPSVNPGLLRLFSRSRAYQAQSQRIDELFAELDSLMNRLPSSQGDVESPALLADEARRLSEELPSDIPEPVRQLFQCVNDQTATVGHLTEEVMRWLKENEMLSDLRVSWRP